MVRLLMEAFMIIAIVTGMVFMMRVSAKENQADEAENNLNPEEEEK